MKKQDSRQSTLFPADSPVSRSRLPGSEEARRTTVTSGRRCSESYTNSGPLGCLVRTCLESSIWHSTRCYLTWRRQATKGRRSLFRLAASMPRTDETGCVFWPTPSTGAALCGGTGNFKTLERMATKGLITEEERRELSKGNGGKTNPELLEWLMGYEAQFTKMIPTPSASDYKGAPKDRFYSQGIHVEREREREREREQVPPQPSRTCGSHAAWDNWPSEPGVGRVADGVSYRVDRIKALGNAVVPQQFYIFFKIIHDIEKGSKP